MEEVEKIVLELNLQFYECFTALLVVKLTKFIIEELSQIIISEKILIPIAETNSARHRSSLGPDPCELMNSSG